MADDPSDDTHDDHPRRDDPGPDVDELVDLIGRLGPGLLIAAIGPTPSGRPGLAVRPLAAGRGVDAMAAGSGRGVEALDGLRAPAGATAIAVALTGTSPDHPGELRIDAAVDRAGRGRYRVRDPSGRPVVDSDRASGRLVDDLHRLLGVPEPGAGWPAGELPANESTEPGRVRR